MKKIITASLALSLSCAPGTGKAGEIRWDAVGVPHIQAATIPEAARGLGRAEMENHAEQLLLNVAAARGRFAEYFGSGPHGSYVESDIRIRTFGIPERAEVWWQASSPRQKAILTAFASGANAYAATHAGSIPPAIRKILPLRPQDALMLSQWTIQYGFMAREAAALVADWSAGSNRGGGVHAPAPALSPAGSNAWAVAPGRSASGHAMLIGNPHLVWASAAPAGQDAGSLFNPQQGMLQWMMAHIVIGNPRHPRLNLSGASFLGIPDITIGFTDRLGWSHTVNWLRAADVFEITLDGDHYRYGQDTRTLESRHDSLRICDPGVPCLMRDLVLQSSVHGPIVARKGNKALALRVAGNESSGLIDQYWDMALARDLNGFQRATARLQMPYFNIVYADRDGHIMYAFGGSAPQRPSGTYADWTRILDGANPALTSQTTLRWSQLPRTIDPPGGFVQNSNDAPWTSTFPQQLSPRDFPAWLARDDMDFRPQHGALFLQSRPRFSLADLIEGIHSTRLVLADRVLDDLIAAARASADPDAHDAAGVLAAWDRTAQAESRGAVLFDAWYAMAGGARAAPDAMFRLPFDPAHPLTTPAGLADPVRAAALLADAARTLREAHGSIDIAWGAVHRIRLSGRSPDFRQAISMGDLPASGADNPLGGLHNMRYLPAGPDGIQSATGAEGYIQAVEFTPQGAKARMQISYGNASRPGSAHITDQLSDFAHGRIARAPRTHAEVVAATVRKEMF